MTKPLTPFQLWMVKQNVQYAKKQGLRPVVANLIAQGYDRVAKAVEESYLETSCDCDYECDCHAYTNRPE